MKIAKIELLNIIIEIKTKKKVPKRNLQKQLQKPEKQKQQLLKLQKNLQNKKSRNSGLRSCFFLKVYSL